MKEWFTVTVSKVFSVVQSRKFWAAVGTTFVLLGGEATPEAKASGVAAIWIAFIFGTALEDGLRNR